MPDDLRAMLYAIAPDEGEPWGWIGLTASARGLRYLGLPAVDAATALQSVRGHYPDVALNAEDPFLLDVAHQVDEYLHRARRVFAVDLDLRGHTTFELSVWAITSRIIYSETRTYGWIAGQVGGGPGVAQAVGAALGNNPVPLIVPCHRVIGSDGSLHGFAGGLRMKARLLALENLQMALPLNLG